MPGFTTVTRENVIVSVGKNTQVDVAAEALDRPGDRHGHERRRRCIDHAQGRDGPELLARRADRDPDLPRRLVADPAGAGRPARHRQRRRQPERASPAARTSSRRARATSPTRSTARPSRTTPTANPFARQNGGTNTFFDFSTFQDVEVATGGSLLEQQNSGVTINVVTKRGTNEFQGAARYLYASGNWQSNNTPQEAHGPGAPDEQHADDPRVRRGLRRPDHQGQAVALVRRRPTRRSRRTRPTFESRPSARFASPDTGQPRALEREAELADLQRQLGAALLPAQRPDPAQRGAGARPRRPRRRPMLRSRRTSTRSRTRTSSRRTSSPRSSRTTRTPTTPTSATARKDCTPTDFTVACGGNGTTGTSSTTNQTATCYHNNYYYYWRQGSAEAGQRPMSKFFNTGSLNHEVKFSFNYRQQIADSATGWPGDQNHGQRVLEHSSLQHGAALPRRAAGLQEPVLSGTLGDTITVGNLTAQLGVRYDQPAGARTFPRLRALRERRMLPGPAPDGPVPRRRRLAVRLHELAAARLGDLRPGREEDDAAAGLVRAVRRPARVHRLLRSGVPISNGYYYYWTDINKRPHRPAERGPLRAGRLRLLQRHRPGDAAERPEHDRPEPEDAEDERGHLRRRPAVHRHPRRLGDVQLPQRRTTSCSFRPAYELDDWALAGSDPVRADDNGNLGPCVAVAPNGFTLPFDEPFYSPAASPRSRPASRSHDRPGSDAEVLRRRRLGRQTIVGPLDVPRRTSAGTTSSST